MMCSCPTRQVVVSCNIRRHIQVSWRGREGERGGKGEGGEGRGGEGEERGGE